MRPSKYFCLAMALLFPAVLYAGQVYGSITSGGRGVARANIEISCGTTISKGGTSGDGSYRINVPQQGQCNLVLLDYPGRPSAVIFSSPNPSLYNFELVRRPDGNYELRRR
jgi:hypothetical protein